MTIHRELIAKKVKGQLGEREEWWHLCYDTSERKYYIEHTWDYADAYNIKKPNNSGSKIYPVENWKDEGAENIQSAREEIAKKIN